MPLELYLVRLGAWVIAIFVINISMTLLVNNVGQGELVGTPLSMSGNME